jgi:antitoxin ParD1/3/4
VPDAYVLTPEAKQDLELIWQYIAEDSFDAANHVEAMIYKAFDLLSAMPEAGHWRRDLTERPVRFWPASPYKNYLVVYDSQARPVRIIRIIHAALNARPLLSEST